MSNSIPRYLWSAFRRGLYSIVTIVKLYIFGIAYQFGGVIGAVLVGLMLLWPLAAFPDNVPLSTTLVLLSGLVGFTAYGALRLKVDNGTNLLEDDDILD